MKEIKNLYYDGYTIKDLQKAGPKNTYILYITCDANVGSIIVLLLTDSYTVCA